jgi:hypothetical protein
MVIGGIAAAFFLDKPEGPAPLMELSEPMTVVDPNA